ncbi:MAG: NADH-quinone oxidoreductase subunit M [Sulfobacillus benefaciens]|uniref:NADH-quinone oxidoreductase subunit M n=1 Tax=Sulfobacillus benefaciens TaxID=453960 RepID=A0A2T2X0Y1_9FIRM|nr:MAG: NADH-quinone oxidoreductase subunit M [Sulfobacillus benefaciens]
MLALLIVPCLFMIILPRIPATWLKPAFVTMALADLLLALGALAPGNVIHVAWWPQLGLNLSLGVTPYNQPLLWLNALVLLSSAWTANRGNAWSPLSKGSIFWLTVAYVGVSLAFLSQNVLLYFVGFEMAVLPFFLLVRKDGGENRRVAAFYFLGFSAVAGMMLLAAVLTLVVHHVTGFHANHPVSVPVQFVVYLLLLATWAIKTPLWPFHLWLPKTHGEASTPASMYLSGVALKVAPYGFLLFSGILPAARHQASPFLAVWGGITLLAGSLLALGQRDLKQTVAQSSIASMGYVMIALSLGTRAGDQAAVLVMVGHGLASPLLFWIAGQVQKIQHSRQLDDLPGLYRKDPLLVTFLTAAAFAYMGIPGLALFPGEFGVILVALKHAPLTLYLIAPAIVIMAATWLRILARARFGGTETDGSFDSLSAVRQESWSGLWLSVPLVLVGLIPEWWIHLWRWGGLR